MKNAQCEQKDILREEIKNIYNRLDNETPKLYKVVEKNTNGTTYVIENGAKHDSNKFFEDLYNNVINVFGTKQYMLYSEFKKKYINKNYPCVDAIIYILDNEINSRLNDEFIHKCGCIIRKYGIPFTKITINNNIDNLEIKKIIDKLSNNNRVDDRYISQYVNLTDWTETMINYNISYISGPAGCGKTTFIVDYIYPILKELNYKIVVCAITANAGKNLKDRLNKQYNDNIDAKTIAYLEKNEVISSKKICYIIDEISMVDIKSFGGIYHPEDKYIMIGDENQLPPINNNMTTIDTLKIHVPDFEKYKFDLGKKNFRTNNTNIQQLFDGVLNKEPSYELIKNYDGGAVKFNKLVSKNYVDNIVEEYKTFIGGDFYKSLKENNTVFLTYTNELSVEINEKISKKLNGREKKSCEIKSTKNSIKLNLRTNDNMVFIKNKTKYNYKYNYAKNLYDEKKINNKLYEKMMASIGNDYYYYHNSLKGRVVFINDDYVEIKILNENRKIILPLCGEPLDILHGYAMTVHKSQGLGFDNICFVIKDRIKSELFYTAITRAKEKLMIMYPNDNFLDGYEKKLRIITNDVKDTINHVFKLLNKNKEPNIDVEQQYYKIVFKKDEITKNHIISIKKTIFNHLLRYFNDLNLEFIVNNIKKDTDKIRYAVRE